MFRVLLAIGRTSGWTSQWLDMIDDQEPKIEPHARSTRVAGSFTTSDRPALVARRRLASMPDAGRPIGQAVSAGNGQERMKQ